MALSAADLERARQLAADAPPLSPEQRERIRVILTGCQPQPATDNQADQDGTADAA